MEQIHLHDDERIVLRYLTDEWKRWGLQEGQQFATLTNIITQTR